MTNRDYFETKHIPFDIVMREFNEKNFKSFDDFLNSDRLPSHKFKKGDIVVLNRQKANEEFGDAHFKHNIVYRILETRAYDYLIEQLTPGYHKIGFITSFGISFINKVCELY